ncbi:putative bifunctional diguanylate cyclase/phosphodiesterase [Pseudooctadecabacter jejudonensis]|uniref:Phytochrome-like protein cph2 n=1 Tax=Pseudooctadecabacter jejudonensis TaxID=1391910 RepID=A0A1Y5T2A5_9RHOB|nr:EAL domain-containing protein [Pseudooctadecabacter jejudonensis]SLN50490.1 Phytochrome-like protein cph2 [Pseudooctadecabacter jejudonensis]
MYRIYACITQDHHFGLLAFAVASCLTGSIIFVLLLRRMVRSEGRHQVLYLALASIIGGATIWSTHFLSMLAYDPGVQHVYDPVLTIKSLLIAAVGLLISCVALAYCRGWMRVVLPGALFGLTVATMHYTGMNAVILPGHILWEADRVLWSVVAGTVLGVMGYHRILYPYTRYCRSGAIALIILAICAMHFTGMTAFTIALDSGVPVPEQLVSDQVFAIFVVSVATVLYLVGYFSFGIDTENIGRMREAVLKDPLTGLPNRIQLKSVMAKLGRQLAEDTTMRVAVLTFDLDNFKHINDSQGHAVGDEILCSIAARLAETLGPAEFVARYGGDEFVIIKWNFQRVDQVVAMADRLNGVLMEPIEVSAGVFSVGISIGAATSIEDGRDIEDLMKKSDMAMYHAKSQPDIYLAMFDEAMAKASHARIAMIADLRTALEVGHFELNYQIQNAMSTLEPEGFEALIRWRHPEKGLIAPDDFIPLAEETGLIRGIGLWVLNTACEEAAKWTKPYSIAVNVAPQQLVQPSFVDQVAMTLDKTGLDPARLELEITEAGMINDPENTLRVMTELKAMGIRIAMDDFGTGYSSLASLQAFPFDKIKIDRSFVNAAHSDEQRAAIVRSTLLLGHALKIPVLAEGVEDESDLEFLRAENCASVQGFYFGLPLSHEQLQQVVSGEVLHSTDVASKAS